MLDHFFLYSSFPNPKSKKLILFLKKNLIKQYNSIDPGEYFLISFDNDDYNDYVTTNDEMDIYT